MPKGGTLKPDKIDRVSNSPRTIDKKKSSPLLLASGARKSTSVERSLTEYSSDTNGSTLGKQGLLKITLANTSIYLLGVVH